MNNDNIPIIAMIYNCIIFMFDTFCALDNARQKSDHESRHCQVNSEAMTIAFCTVHAWYIR